MDCPPARLAAPLPHGKDWLARLADGIKSLPVGGQLPAAGQPPHHGPSAWEGQPVPHDEIPAPRRRHLSVDVRARLDSGANPRELLHEVENLLGHDDDHLNMATATQSVGDASQQDVRFTSSVSVSGSSIAAMSCVTSDDDLRSPNENLRANQPHAGGAQSMFAERCHSEPSQRSCAAADFNPIGDDRRQYHGSAQFSLRNDDQDGVELPPNMGQHPSNRNHSLFVEEQAFADDGDNDEGSMGSFNSGGFAPKRRNEPLHKTPSLAFTFRQEQPAQPAQVDTKRMRMDMD